MSNAILFVCYGKSHIVVLITKHINMNESIHDKIAHHRLKIPLLTVESITEYTREHLDKNIGSKT